MTTSDTILTGRAAIEFAAANSLTLNKYADPVEGARTGLMVAEAREIAAQDAGLIWIEVSRIEAGKPGTEDYDTGNVLEIDGDRARIGWDSGVQTWAQVADLRPL